MSVQRERYSLSVYLRFFDLESRLGRDKPRKEILQQLSGVRNWPSCVCIREDPVVEGSSDTPLPEIAQDPVKEVFVDNSPRVKINKRTLYSKNSDRSDEFRGLVGRRARRQKREEEFVMRRTREVRNHIAALQPRGAITDGVQSKVQSLQSRVSKLESREYDLHQTYNGDIRSPSITDIAHRVFLRGLAARGRDTYRGRRLQMEYLDANKCRRSDGWCVRGKHVRGPCSNLPDPRQWLLQGYVRHPRGSNYPFFGNFLGCDSLNCISSHSVPWEGREWLRSEPGKSWLLSAPGQIWLVTHSPAGWERCILGGNCWLGDGTRTSFSKRCPCMLAVHRIAR